PQGHAHQGGQDPAAEHPGRGLAQPARQQTDERGPGCFPPSRRLPGRQPVAVHARMHEHVQNHAEDHGPQGRSERQHRQGHDPAQTQAQAVQTRAAERGPARMDQGEPQGGKDPCQQQDR
ncbi:hypothetical protein RZS08_31725, partial [Arthrospira platensis SPKY1]|nr:hypothetical protein [Arthrospira platensis SPKY1]